MPRDADIRKISQIFLSATAEDCKVYRAAVRDSLQIQFKTAKIFLQEQWAEGGQLTVEVCKDRVLKSDAYIGLFAYRYGWQPPKQTVSITEIEFLWARERWKKAPAPVFIMLPLDPSEATNQLRAAAQPLLDKEFPAAADREAAERRRQAFIGRVRSWADEQVMSLEFFGTCEELVAKAAASVMHWNESLLLEALQGRRGPAGGLDAAELGRIGRRSQREMLDKVLEVFADRRDERCIAFLVHGPENHGQLQFAESLAGWDAWDGMEVRAGQAPDAGSTDSLVGWLCGQFNEPVQGGAGVDRLAALLAARLAQGSVVVVLRSVGDRPDRLATFQADFWQPLRAALAQRKPAGTGRLYCFVVDHRALPADPGPAVAVADIDADDQDCAQLLALPVLAPITRAQVLRWLKDICDPKAGLGIVLDEQRRQKIADRATGPGGYPPDVYDRLDREGFWAQQ